MEEKKEETKEGRKKEICEQVVSHLNESVHVRMSHVTHTISRKCALTTNWLRLYITNKLYLTNQRVTAHTNESCHVRMSHVTYVNQARQIWNESCHIYT